MTEHGHRVRLEPFPSDDLVRLVTGAWDRRFAGALASADVDRPEEPPGRLADLRVDRVLAHDANRELERFGDDAGEQVLHPLE